MPNGWPTITRTLSGSGSLHDLQRTIIHVEMQENAKLIGLEIGYAEGQKVNLATFEILPLSEHTREAELIELPDPNALPNVIASAQARGRSFVLTSSIYVEGTETPVAVCR